MIFGKNSDVVKAHKKSKTLKESSKSSKKSKKEINIYRVPGVPVGSFLYFGSGMKAPYNKLSNFSECPVTLRLWVLKNFNEFYPKEYTFPSSEHAWWAHFLIRDVDINRLAVGGDMAKLRTGLAHFYDGEVLSKKIEYWGKKSNVGIVAKLLAGKKGTNIRQRAKELGFCMSLHASPKYGPQGADSTLSKIWSRILLAKYTQNASYRQVLLGSGDHQLVEFTRAGIDRIYKSFWCGRVEKNELHGQNFMGSCMMSAREVIRSMS